MRSSRWTPAILVALLVLGLAIAGCGGGRLTLGGAASATGNDINPVARQQLANGGTLRWPLPGFPPNFNDHELDGPGIENDSVLGALLPRPFTIDATGVLAVNKEYFESVELTSTEPKQVVTYRINPKAVWYDGTPITVVDFQAQWKALGGSNPAFRVASTQGYDTVENVAAGRDDREVVVTFKTNYADWRALFDMLYPASTNTDPNVFNTGWKRQPLTTAGPFKLASLNQTTKTITLVRNEKWWGRPAKLERIIYRVMNPDAQVDALANGEIDFIDVGADLNRFQRAQAIQGVTVRRAGASNFVNITINGMSEVLTDVRVRRALAMGIDRGRIAQALIAPLGVAPAPLGNHIFLANQTGYQDNSSDVGRYNPQQATALLDEAGWRLHDGVRTKDGKELTVRYVIPAQITVEEQTAELVQGMLSKIGVKLSIETLPLNEFQNFISSGNFDLTAFVLIGTPFPISSSKSFYVNPRRGPDGQLDIQQNYARVGSDEIDRLFDQATAELDPAKAVQLANEIDARIWQEVHSLALYQRPDIVATNTNLANFGAFGIASKTYEDIGFLVMPKP
ncbi:MAG: peptide ABC transporter substrate-binding protein [Pseudonocardiales bacterium]|nr:MAG: peptide ABC transporter substrate-binding protein [Pseudonocardiales bacterium]